MKGELKMFGNKGKGQREVEWDMRIDVYVKQDVRFWPGKKNIFENNITYITGRPGSRTKRQLCFIVETSFFFFF